MFSSNLDVFKFVDKLTSHLDDIGCHKYASALKAAMSSSQSSSEILGNLLLELVELKDGGVLDGELLISVNELILAIKKAQSR